MVLLLQSIKVYDHITSEYGIEVIKLKGWVLPTAFVTMNSLVKVKQVQSGPM